MHFFLVKSVLKIIQQFMCPLDAKIDHQSTMINVGLNCFSSPTRQIFTSSYGDTTITDEMLKIFAYTQHF